MKTVYVWNGGEIKLPPVKFSELYLKRNMPNQKPLSSLTSILTFKLKLQDPAPHLAI